MQQKKLLLALVLSMGILVAWHFLFPAQQTDKNNGATPSPSASSTATPAATTSTQTPSATQAPAPNVTAAAKRLITIKTPLYEVKFDTLGAEPVSWIIKKNQITDSEIFSVAGRKRDRVPLELISAEGLNRQPRVVPFQLQTGDAALDAALATSTYKVEGVQQESGDVDVSLAKGEKKVLTFVFEDAIRVFEDQREFFLLTFCKAYIDVARFLLQKVRRKNSR